MILCFPSYCVKSNEILDPLVGFLGIMIADGCRCRRIWEMIKMGRWYLMVRFSALGGKQVEHFTVVGVGTKP